MTKDGGPMSKVRRKGGGSDWAGMQRLAIEHHCPFRTRHMSTAPTEHSEIEHNALSGNTKYLCGLRRRRKVAVCDKVDGPSQCFMHDIILFLAQSQGLRRYWVHLHWRGRLQNCFKM
jgi:hypothetical protein